MFFSPLPLLELNVPFSTEGRVREASDTGDDSFRHLAILQYNNLQIDCLMQVRKDIASAHNELSLFVLV